MKYVILLINLLMSLTLVLGCGDKKMNGASESPNVVATWDVSSLRIFYKDDPYKLARLALDELRTMNASLINSQNLKLLFKTAKYKKGTPMLKSVYFGLLELADGSIEKLIISNYGGFFLRINQNEGYYYFETNSQERKMWDDFIKGRY